MHQVEAIINWNLSSTTFERLKISNRLILEQVANRKGDFCIIAYVGVEDEPYNMRLAKVKSYLDIFVLTCALTSDISATYRVNVGTEISDLDELGEHRITGFEKVSLCYDYMNFPSIKPILLVKERFCELKKDRREIVDSNVGLALRHYYFALQAYYREPKMIGEMIREYATSLEALLKERMDKSPQIIDKLCRFIADYESKSDIIEKMKRFYSLRNDIVHGDKKIIILEDLKDTLIVKIYVQKAIDKALSLKIYDKTQLIEFIQKDSIGTR